MVWYLDFCEEKGSEGLRSLRSWARSQLPERDGNLPTDLPGACLPGGMNRIHLSKQINFLQLQSWMTIDHMKYMSLLASRPVHLQLLLTMFSATEGIDSKVPPRAL